MFGVKLSLSTTSYFRQRNLNSKHFKNDVDNVDNENLTPNILKMSFIFNLYIKRYSF